MDNTAEARYAYRFGYRALIAVGLAVGLLSWLLVSAGDDDLSSKPEPSKRAATPVNIPAGAPTAASVEQLKALARSLDYPVYWAGSRAGQTQEVTRMADGRVFIRYLPPNVPVGTSSLGHTFVATFPQQGALTRVRKAARAKGAVTVKLPRGGLAVINARKDLLQTTARPLSPPPVFFAYPRSSVLLEAYDRSLKRALRLVVSGRVRPIR